MFFLHIGFFSPTSANNTLARGERTSIVVLEQEGPVARIDGRGDGLRLDDLLLLLGGARLHNIHRHVRDRYSNRVSGNVRLKPLSTTRPTQQSA